MKEIINIEFDEDLGMTDVTIRVPEFQNFGQKMGELQSKAFQMMLTPGGQEQILENLSGMIGSLTEGIARDQKKIDAMPDGPQKESAQDALNMSSQLMGQLQNETEAATTLVDETDIDDDDDSFEYDLQELCVQLPEGMKWDKSAENKVDKFLDEWDAVRPLVLERVFKYYQEIYPEALSDIGDDPGAKLTLPKPDSPDSVADLFLISGIHLRDDNAIGLGCDCTWDEEHGCGIVIEGGQVKTVGHADEAFD